jgi:hypothetical protein
MHFFCLIPIFESEHERISTRYALWIDLRCAVMKNELDQESYGYISPSKTTDWSEPVEEALV